MSMLVGGVSDKLGNGYEAQWTLLEALNVLQARADEIRTEPFNEHAAGLEFRVNANGRKYWHQCKRRVASGSWTMRALDSEGVLRAFAGKLIDPSNNCVFVSSDPAASLKSLVEKARLAESAVSYLEGISGSDRRERKVLLESWAIDPDTELDWLKRCRVEIVSEDTMNQQFESRASLLFEADVAVARMRDELNQYERL
ncbi:MAG: hypothetical protein JNM13_02235 [Hyphomicrobiaceae bacterium]|nr:hypothetical protein [Hyphomicrobiaceae bacterium]